LQVEQVEQTAVKAAVAVVLVVFHIILVKLFPRVQLIQLPWEQVELAVELLRVIHFQLAAQIQYLATLFLMAVVLVVKERPETVQPAVLVVVDEHKVAWVLVVQQIKVQLVEQLVTETQVRQQPLLIRQAVVVVLE
jgi:hypothetical protein